MLRQLLRRGQLTLPPAFLRELGLKEKDYVQVTRGEGGILIRPVSISDYSPAELEALREKLDRLPRGEKKTFRGFSESRRHLDSLKRR